MNKHPPPRSFRLSEELMTRLDKHAAVATLMKGAKVSRSEVVTTALETYLTEFETHLTSVYESIDEIKPMEATN